MSTKISIIDVKDHENIPEAVIEAIKLIENDINFDLTTCKNILIKPNLLSSKKDACTQPGFVEGTLLYLKNIGVELERHKKQLKLLLDNRGGHSKEKIKEIIVKFYKLVPTYLRGIKRIDSNKWITEEDKKELLGDEHD